MVKIETDHHSHFSALAHLKGMNEDGERIDVKIEKTDEDELCISWGVGDNFEVIYISFTQFLNFLHLEDLTGIMTDE